MAPEVRVNALTPGGVYRNHDPEFVRRYENLTPLARMASEDDFVGPALFLASDLARYVTGHDLVVDGGFSVW
jgi:NAD(P)-dependent dehydrogenase (short-subunit alcohol dehydrogenase family)